jgi:hypothetical protein
MTTSPWNYYGRPTGKHDETVQRPAEDPTFGAEAHVARTREQLVQYLRQTLEEYSSIRAGERGYQKMIADALAPPPRPESIEETLRRLTGEKPPRNTP